MGRNRDRGPDDYEHDDWSVLHWRPVVRANLLTVIVAVVSLGGQLTAIAWYGGRLEQKVTNNTQTIDKQDLRFARQEQELKELRREIGTQGNAIAATNVAYADILRRLDSIDRKLDRR